LHVEYQLTEPMRESLPLLLASLTAWRESQDDLFEPE
jgi:hypothetical protein